MVAFDRKSKKKSHTANFLIRRFLNSQYSFELQGKDKIDVYDVAILHVCADMMDKNKDDVGKVLYGLQSTIALNARVGRQYLNERFKKYIRLEIFKQITFYRGRSNKYVFGSAIFSNFQVATDDKKYIKLPNKPVATDDKQCIKSKTSTLQVATDDKQVATDDKQVATDDTYDNKSLMIIRALNNNAVVSLIEKKKINSKRQEKDKHSNNMEALKMLGKKLGKTEEIKH